MIDPEPPQDQSQEEPSKESDQKATVVAPAAESHVVTIQSLHQISKLGNKSADGRVFHATPDYLKQITEKDHLYPRLKPLFIVCAILLTWWAFLLFTYTDVVIQRLDDVLTSTLYAIEGK